MQTGRLSLTSGGGTLSFCSSRAQLLPLALSLEYLSENKAWILFHLTNTRYPAQKPTVFCLTIMVAINVLFFFFFFTLSVSVWKHLLVMFLSKTKILVFLWFLCPDENISETDIVFGSYPHHSFRLFTYEIPILEIELQSKHTRSGNLQVLTPTQGHWILEITPWYQARNVFFLNPHKG